MPQVARIEVADHWYHVIARGQRQDALFLGDDDRRTYLRLLGECIARNGASIGAYCLMDNHLHLLVFRREALLGTIFRQLHMSYAKYFNQKFRKVGYVFQGRFKSYLVLNDRYLAALLRYIHENPVGAGMVARPEDYRWSSDCFYRGGQSTPGLVLRRVPGFEEKRGSHGYTGMMNGIFSTEDIPKFGQMIGTQDEIEATDKRKTGRQTWVTNDRRGRTGIEGRVRELIAETGMSEDLLLSKTRRRDAAAARRTIMAKLYQEGYPPAAISKQFRRTPSAVIRAFERQSKCQS